MSTNIQKSYSMPLAALSLAMLLPSLGTSIANVALPSLKSALGGTSQDVQWVVIIYLMAVTATLVTAGRLGDLLGKRRVLLSGIGLFTAASIAAVFASELWVLILARGIQGLGAATMMALTVAAVGDMVPKDRAGSAMGLLGTVSAVGTAMGPSLGGILIATFGWPSVFALMGLAGAVTFVFAYHLLPKDAPRVKPSPSFDFAGTALLVASLATFALATTVTPTTYVNLLLAGAAAVGLAGFILVQRMVTAPLVQLQLLQHRSIGTGLVSIGLVSAIMMTTLVVGPFYLASTLELGPAATGLVMTIGPAVAALVGVPAGRLVDHFGPTKPTVTGLTGVLFGALLMTWLPNAFGVGGYAASLILITGGYALFQAANNTAVMESAGNQQRGVTSALLSLARNLGLVTGASAMGSLFAFGSGGLPMLGLQQGGEAGLQLAFIVATILAALALVSALWGLRTRVDRPTLLDLPDTAGRAASARDIEGQVQPCSTVPR